MRWTFAAITASLTLATPACAGKLSDFALGNLTGWADALAVCDVTRFLLTEPDLQADSLPAAGQDNTHGVLRKPLYIPPNNFYSSVMREAYEKLKKTGQISPHAYDRARVYYASSMIAAYRNAGMADRRALTDQMDACYRLAARAGVSSEPQR